MIWHAMTLMVVGVTAGYVGFLATDRELPLILTKMELVPQERPSRTVYFNYEGFRSRLCDVTVSRFYFDPSRVRLTLSNITYPANTNNVGDDKYRTKMDLPEDATEGDAMYRTVNCYVCNPLQRIVPICAPPRDIKFKVTKEMLLGTRN